MLRKETSDEAWGALRWWRDVDVRPLEAFDISGLWMVDGGHMSPLPD